MTTLPPFSPRLVCGIEGPLSDFPEIIAHSLSLWPIVESFHGRGRPLSTYRWLAESIRDSFVAVERSMSRI